MPTIELSLRDLNGLVGKKFSLKQLHEALQYVKGEIESSDGDRVKIEIADTNRPDLWSVEGVARELRGRYANDKGLAKYKTKKSGLRVIVDKSLKNIRPLTVCAVIKGLEINDETLFQMIQLQEKICETFGRGRREVALGIYDYHKISPPVYFRACKPDEIEFIPLDFDRKVNLRQVLSQHPKGRQYGHLLAGFEKYPVFIDSKGQVLSMPPIINSDHTGKVTKETKDIFIECSGFHFKFLMPALNIMVSALADRGGNIETVDLVLPDRKIETPDMEAKKMVLDVEEVRKLSGLGMRISEIKKLLLQSRYGVENEGNKLVVSYPPYRQDIMHQVDVVEDIIISYGYNRIEPLALKIATVGKSAEINLFSSKVSEIMVGLGAQEVLSYILTNKDCLFRKMNMEVSKAIEVENPVSKNWCVFRTWIIPSLIEFLGKNTNREYPQNIFEIGEVVLLDEKAETKTSNPVRLAWTFAGSGANFTRAKQSFDVFMRGLGLEYKIEEASHPSFIPGRAGRISVKGKKIAYMGEIHPQVLENFGIEQPVCAFEVNLSDILKILKG